MAEPNPARIMTFASPKNLGQWLKVNYATESKLWVKIFKIKTGIPSVTWEGSADSQPIGYAAKTPSMIVVTRSPDIESLKNVLATEAANTIKNLAADRLEDYLAYQAYPTDKYQDMLSQRVE